MDSLQNHCILKHNNRVIIITQSPTFRNIVEYVEYLKENKINLVIKLTDEKLYDTAIYQLNSIDYKYMYIQDGMLPNIDQIAELYELSKKYNNICVHCKAGLGRAPTVGALLGLFMFKIDPFDLITEIKNQIVYALNRTQLNFILDFKIKKYDKKKESCVVM